MKCHVVSVEGTETDKLCGTSITIYGVSALRGIMLHTAMAKTRNARAGFIEFRTPAWPIQL